MSFSVISSRVKLKPVYNRRKFLLQFLGLVTACLCASQAVCLAQSGSDQFVRLETSKGPIVLRVFYSQVPYTAGNFLDLVEAGFYDGLNFHRVENWVIQGGDPNGNGSGYATDPNTGAPRYLNLEIKGHLNHNQPGILAMARGNNPNSASCQFYILKAPMPQLNGKYAVFGRVVNGMNVVAAIRPGDKIVSARILPPPQPAPASGTQTQRSESTGSAEGGRSSRPPADSGF